MDADGARLGRQAVDEHFDFLAVHRHQIRHFIDDDDKIRKALERFFGDFPAFRIHHRFLLAEKRSLAISYDVPGVSLFQNLIPVFHFSNRPAQRVDDLLHFHNHIRFQMRDSLEDRQLHTLGINQNEF